MNTGFSSENQPEMPTNCGTRAVAGVDIETWLAVEVGIVVDSVHRPAEQDAYAAARGVPVGEWAAVSKEWNVRARKDFRVGARLGAAHQAAADARG